MDLNSLSHLFRPEQRTGTGQVNLCPGSNRVAWYKSDHHPFRAPTDSTPEELGEWWLVRNNTNDNDRNNNKKHSERQCGKPEWALPEGRQVPERSSHPGGQPRPHKGKPCSQRSLQTAGRQCPHVHTHDTPAPTTQVMLPEATQAHASVFSKAFTFWSWGKIAR